MKKVYAKPQIAFEDFSLNTSIAAGCKYISNWIEGQCGWEDEIEGIIFISKEAGCIGAEAPNGEWGNICYDNPSEGYGLFSS